MHIFGIIQRMNIRIFVRRTGLLVGKVSILRHRKLAFGCNKMITLKPRRLSDYEVSVYFSLLCQRSNIFVIFLFPSLPKRKIGSRGYSPMFATYLSS